MDQEQLPEIFQAIYLDRKRGSYTQNNVLRLLECDWDEFYITCPTFQKPWDDMKNCNSMPWPQGYKKVGSPEIGYKMFHEEKLCVPKALVNKKKLHNTFFLDTVDTKNF